MNIITRQTADKPLTVTIEYPRLDSQTQSIIRKIRSLDFKINGKANGNPCHGNSCHDRFFSISVSDIYYIETVERRTFIYTEKEIYLSDKKLYELEQILSETDIVRISKSCLMNMDMLLCVEQLFNSQLEATLTNGEKLIVARNLPKNADTLRDNNFCGFSHILFIFRCSRRYIDRI